MIDYTPLYQHLQRFGLASLAQQLPPLVAARLAPEAHGDLAAWNDALAALPAIPASGVDLNAGCLRVNSHHISADQRERLVDLLQRFHPWRKGPFCIHGIHIDTEWRSDWKWNRVRDALDLNGKTVLDVGCGNGYYGWRMIGAGASLVLGIDPTLLYVAQYAAVRRFIGDAPNYVLPFRLEELPPSGGAFDVVFSMGVLYHRRDPRAHLELLRTHMKRDATLVLETLVVDGGPGAVLIPGERYAKMKNVWTIPSVDTAGQWLEDCGFADVRCVDETVTTTDEQRTTEWMRFESLAQFLDPDDPRKTIEGLPAPKRAVLLARNP